MHYFRNLMRTMSNQHNLILLLITSKSRSNRLITQKGRRENDGNYQKVKITEIRKTKEMKITAMGKTSPLVPNAIKIALGFRSAAIFLDTLPFPPTRSL